MVKHHVGLSMNHNLSDITHQCHTSYKPSNYSCHSIPDTLILIVYTMIFILNFIANTLVIIVIALKRRNKSFTGYMIFNLCVADLTIGVVCILMEIPMETYPYKWIYGSFICRLFYPIQSAMIYASVLSFVALSCARYLAIVHPYTSAPNKLQAKILIALIWVLSFSVVTPYMAALEMNEATGQCEEVWERDNRRIFSALTFSVQYCVPVLIITFAYSGIVYDLNSTRHRRKSLKSFDKVKRGENSKLTKLVLIMTVTFALCVLPYHTVALWVEFGSGASFKNIEDLSIIAFFILYLNSGLNPILYGVLSSKFRREVRDTWKSVSSRFDTRQEDI